MSQAGPIRVLPWDPHTEAGRDLRRRGMGRDPNVPSPTFKGLQPFLQFPGSHRTTVPLNPPLSWISVPWPLRIPTHEV